MEETSSNDVMAFMNGEENKAELLRRTDKLNSDEL